MRIIITMAGDGTRFKQVGIKKPKHKIIIKGKTLFEYSMLSLKLFFDNEFIFIGREGHKNNLFISEKCSTLGIKKYNIINLLKLTKGQASTALKVKDVLEEYNSPILIYNIDTYVEPGVINPRDIKGDGWIPCFKAEGERWSFVVTEKNSNKVIKVAEKERISDLASIGLYYFSSFSLFEEAYRRWNYNKGQEEYIAPLYNYLIEENFSVFTEILPKNKVHVLGTPEDINKFDPNFN